MIKNTFFLIVILFFQNNASSQKYFRIEGTKQIFTFYGKKRSLQINDSISVLYYVRNNNFYIAAKKINASVRPYVKYCILNKTDKIRIKAMGRGSNEIKRVKFIGVRLMKVEKTSTESKFIEQTLGTHK